MVKQAGDETFNKNRLLNAGYNFARAHVTDIDFDCIIFHDTDLLLENGTNLYTCDSQHVRHLCPEVDTVSLFHEEWKLANFTKERLRRNKTALIILTEICSKLSLNGYHLKILVVSRNEFFSRLSKDWKVFGKSKPDPICRWPRAIALFFAI